jgi:hypothetical protein
MYRSTYPNYLALLLLLGCINTLGCSNTRAYSGPERPESEIASVYFFSDRSVELSDMRIDGAPKGTFDLGVSVLPGKHVASAEFSIKTEQCEYYGCEKIIYSGHCEVSLNTRAGFKYDVRFRGVTDSAFVHVEEEGSDEISGSGSCATTDRDVSYSPSPSEKRRQ